MNKYIYCENNVLNSLSWIIHVLGGISGKAKIKGCAADCASGSMSIGIAKTSLACCNTDQCNVQDAPGIVLYWPNANYYL